MHGTFNRSIKNRRRHHRNRDFGVLAIPAVLAAALIALVLTEPSASRWISEAAQAEFAASFMMPEPAPTQFAQPVDVISTVRAN